MLIRVREDLSFRSRGPVGLPRPRLAATTSTFPGLYMRPNNGDDGTIPAGSPFSASPDIWIAGLNPVGNYQTALATTASYATQSSYNVFSGQSNIIYVRGKNGGTANKTVTVQLYYAPSGVIQQPSNWQNNVIKTDKGQLQGNITNAAPGAVAVCDATFTWTNPVPPPPGSDHYCLFAQFNDANNSNPFPDPETVFDMGALIMKNLGWGWRNTSMQPATPQWQLSEPVAIPSNYPTQTYNILVTPVGWTGWDVEFHCSETDSKGNIIKLDRTKIVQDGQVLGASKVTLDGGWQGQLTVSLYSPDGRGPPAGATIPLSCQYVGTSRAAILEAQARGLIDWAYLARLRRFCPELIIGPTAVIEQGTYSGTVSNDPAVLDWWEKRGMKIDDYRRDK